MGFHTRVIIVKQNNGTVQCDTGRPKQDLTCSLLTARLAGVRSLIFNVLSVLQLVKFIWDII